jgi:hypothetical protein
VAFELELPPTSKIHSVFHVSQLKPCHGAADPTLNLPAEAVDNQPLIQPLSVLDWNWDKPTQEWQVLIQWEGLFLEDSTWESYQDIQLTYHTFHLEDNVNLEEQGDDVNEESPANTIVVMNPEAKEKRKVVLPKQFQGFSMPTWKKDSRK